MESEEALDHIKNMLRSSYEAVKNKGKEAIKTTDANKDLQTVADLTADRAFIDYLKKSNLPAIYYTEELDKPVRLSKDPEYALIGDPIDGTSNMSKGLGMLPYGGIAGLADKPDPRLKDFIASGFLEYVSGNLFYALKGKGSFMIRNWTGGNGKAVKIATSGVKDIANLNMIVDLYMLGNIGGSFLKYAPKPMDYGSNALHYILVASGAFDVCITGDNCRIPEKRRTGEELAAHLLVKEAGGAFIDWNGNDLGQERIGLQDKKTFHVIAAATPELGQKFVKMMHEMPEIREYMEKKGM
jgi:fructose-1,6-bisphosphatase/inositol monophosphatase family enzyme